MKLRVLELFAGARSIGKQFDKYNHQVISIDWDKDFENIDYNLDLEELQIQDVYDMFDGEAPDVIWASPDCTTYSIASCSTHRNVWDDVYYPKTDYAFKCDRVNMNIIRLIKYFEENHNTLYFIENPRSTFRKMFFVKDLPRYTVAYCQYGDTRKKPTDIFTNHYHPDFKPVCKRGAPCHIKAPRGSKTGTQGLPKHLRSLIPADLCKHIVILSEAWRLQLHE